MEEKSPNNNDQLVAIEKYNILNFLSNIIHRKINSIKRIIYFVPARFGNTLLCLNKIIFFCEIVKCNEIIVSGPSFWFLNNNMVLDESNIKINKINNKTLLLKYKQNTQTVYFNSFSVFFYYFRIKPKISIHLLKKEIMKNLPHLITNKKDLYIHIRSGDIFTNCIHRTYAQPPFCFYKSIFDNFNFSSIYIISQNKNNPNINKLIRKFKNIIYLKQNLQQDLSCLINSYNLVGSISSFLLTVIMLNTKLKSFFEYNLYPMSQKIYQNHYDLFEYPTSFTVYRMEPSTNYKEIMYYWKNNRRQRKLMSKEKCINKFRIIRN